MAFFWSIAAALAAALILTPLVRAAALRFGAVDQPAGGRKIHVRPMPLWGGAAVFSALALAILLALALGWLPGTHIREKYLIGIIIASGLLIVGGLLDDKYSLKPSRQIIWPVLAALVIVGSGIGVKFITNPFGGQLYLDRQMFTVLWWQGLPYRLTPAADVFTLVWLLGMTYTTKFLDGLDGLVSGVAVIGALVIAAVSLMKEVAQPDTALLAFAIAGAFLGFLVFNFHPARIFLGEGGSTLAGFLLGTLAIISGGKIATTLLVLGLPLFDAVFVVLRRVFWLRRSPTQADRSHLHFLLLDVGFTHRQAVLFYYFIAAAFGVSTLFLDGWGKLAALGTLASLLAALGAAVVILKKRAVPSAPSKVEGPAAVPDVRR